MAQLTQDQWAQWLLHRRFGDDAERLNAALGREKYATLSCQGASHAGTQCRAEVGPTALRTRSLSTVDLQKCSSGADKMSIFLKILFP